MRAALLVACLVVLSPSAITAKSNGAYTDAQASRGAAVYAQYCANCHGANLQGESGPALTGQTLRQTYGAGTAAQLYDFISRQMPQDKPGSLTPQQYLDVTAYILERNGFPSGNRPLTVASLGQVRMSQQRIRATATRPNTNEIVRGAPPVRNVYAKLPAGANVNVTDSMMLNAGADENDWLLPGRTYDNQRYSPLEQITPDNVKSLNLVALVQTGMTASFETTPVVVNGVMYITTPVVNKKMLIIAINAATGERLWDVTYNLGPFQVCCGPVNRGVAVGYGKVYVATLDDQLLALDAADGHTIWQTTIVDSQNGYSETLAPQIYDGMHGFRRAALSRCTRLRHRAVCRPRTWLAHSRCAAGQASSGRAHLCPVGAPGRNRRSGDARLRRFYVTPRRPPQTPPPDSGGTGMFTRRGRAWQSAQQPP